MKPFVYKILLLSVFCLPFGYASDQKSAGSKPLNVLFLVADDMNSWILEDPQRYAGKVIAPNLQKLANSGVNFRRTYTAAPVCNPSRTAFFSGIAPWVTGVYNNAQEVDKAVPLKTALSLAGMFKQGGYQTYGFGKITHGWDQKEYWDIKVGHQRDPRPPGAPLISVGAGENDWGPIHIPEEQMNTAKLADQVIAQLNKTHDKPFFLGFGSFNPHMPWYVPQKYFDLFPLDNLPVPELNPNDLDDLPPLGLKVAGGHGGFTTEVLKAGLLKSGVQAYLATFAYVDYHMGRVLDALDKSPYKDNTVVIFLTDHGFHLGEKNHWQKTTLWEEATHTLLFMRVPGLTKAGGNCHRFVSLMDIYPTLAEICSLTPPSNLDGKSLAPLLRDPNSEWESTAITGLCDKTQPQEAFISIRNEIGRYIRYKDGQEEFYDCPKDPHEWTNQINNSAFSSTIEKLKAALPKNIAAPMPTALDDKKARKRGKEDDE